jgi:hypothetical protein
MPHLEADDEEPQHHARSPLGVDALDDAHLPGERAVDDANARAERELGERLALRRPPRLSARAGTTALRLRAIRGGVFFGGRRMGRTRHGGMGAQSQSRSREPVA